MKKALLALISIAIAFTAVAPAQAQDERVLAIIDSAINSNNFPSIIQEACVTTNGSCPNGTNLMEGKMSAAATGWLMDSEGVAAERVSLVSAWPKALDSAGYHGDTMVKSALTVNPNLKIVFVRISNFNGGNLAWTDSKGTKQPAKDAGATSTSPQSLSLAIDWVSKNASKYSIDAVSISQSSISTNNLNACTGVGILANEGIRTINAISLLNASNIPVFVATGNDKRRDVVGFPACVNGAIGVGALGNATQLEGMTNTGPGLDMVALTGVKIPRYGRPANTAEPVYGSSVATVLASASYVNKNTFKTFGEYLSSLPKILIGTASYIRN